MYTKVVPKKAHHLTFEDISIYFDITIEQAAVKLNISTTALKTLCRKLNITRWPCRKIQCLDKVIKSLEEMTSFDNPEEEFKISKELDFLRKSRDAYFQPRRKDGHTNTQKQNSTVIKPVALRPNSSEAQSLRGQIPDSQLTVNMSNTSHTSAQTPSYSYPYPVQLPAQTPSFESSITQIYQYNSIQTQNNVPVSLTNQNQSQMMNQTLKAPKQDSGNLLLILEAAEIMDARIENS